MSDRDEEIQKLAHELYSKCRGDAQRLATLAAQFQLAAKERIGGALEVVGGVSFQTGKPFVQMNWGEQVGQLDVEAARGHAQLIVEAVQNAITDAALYAWALDDDGGLALDQQRAAGLIDALRRYRHDKWGQPDLEIEFSKPPPEEDD